MTARWTAALPLLVAAALLAITTGEQAAALVMAAPIAVALVRPGRLAISVPAQVLLMMACGMVAFVWTTLAPPGRGLAPEPMRAGFAQLAYGALLFAGARLHLRDPAWGLGGTLGAGLLVFLACGTVKIGSTYPLLLVAYAVSCFLALRVDDIASGGRAAGAPSGVRVVWAGAIVVGVTAALTSGFALAIPRLYTLAYEMALDWIDDRHRAGFHDGPIRLGGLDRLLLSDEIVMRVEGDAGDHLRGNVYTHYSRGRWLPSPHRDEVTLRVPNAEEDAAPGGRVRAVVRLVRADADRYFVPPVEGEIALAPAEVRVDTMGVVRTAGEKSAARIALRAGAGRQFPGAAPEAADRAVPDRLDEPLGALVEEWADGIPEVADRVAAIRARLEAGYVYSLDTLGEARGPDDPLLAFLLDDRTGHCEYFASAMTLLARAAGAPARLVTGYRIAEYNPLGEYHVVRERHAHAWSEVYLDGAGWVTVDPSPLRGTAPAEAEVTPFAAGLVDYVRVLWDRRGPETLLVLLVVGLASVQVFRIRRDRVPRAESREAVAPPPEWLDDLLERLAALGVAREFAEPLESVARRARLASAASEGDALAEASLLLHRYTALRYGDEGRADALRGDFTQWLERSASARPEPGLRRV